jgi:dimethylhistidine N-methyltransferase
MKKVLVPHPSTILDERRKESSFFSDVVDGLSRSPKTVPCKYFYDDEGCQLFEKISVLPEYYPTRAECEILYAASFDISRLAGPGASILDYGCGSGKKADLLIQAFDSPAMYLPVDISYEFLRMAASRFRSRYPNIPVKPIRADFSMPIEAETAGARKKIVFFPGSTIGNFTPGRAIELLTAMSLTAGLGGSVIVGVDLKKDPAIIHAAYNDAEGVTEAFNKNLLVRINRELGADFELDAFTHHAPYVQDKGRVEMRLVSRVRQSVCMQDFVAHFEPDEYLLTEFAYKYSLSEFAALAETAGLRRRGVWTDRQKRFSVHYFDVTG